METIFFMKSKKKLKFSERKYIGMKCYNVHLKIKFIKFIFLAKYEGVFETCFVRKNMQR